MLIQVEHYVCVCLSEDMLSTHYDCVSESWELFVCYALYITLFWYILSGHIKSKNVFSFIGRRLYF